MVVQSAVNPGQCSKQEDCSSSYACIALETSRKGITRAAQCTPPVTCAGLESGYCPTFTGWQKAYRSITSVCGLREPTNCRQDPNNVDVDDDDLVDCEKVQINDSEYLMIYACMDALEYKEKQRGFNYTSEQLKNCASQEGDDDGVCNGHGTCVPLEDFRGNFLNYTCRCYVGYKNEDNCLQASSNQCNIPGQCAKGSCNLVTGECECEDGYTGLQCIECDPNAIPELQCNNRGICQSNGTCKCDSEYTGTYCDRNAPNGIGTRPTLSTLTLAGITFLASTLVLFC